MDQKTRIEGLSKLKVFTGNSNPDVAHKICEYLKIPLGDAYVGRFPDGEIDLKINEDIRGSDIFVVQSICPPVNDNLVELLMFIDCIKRASAARITAVIPYYGYARKDRKDEGRVPITAKLVANLICEGWTGWWPWTYMRLRYRVFSTFLWTISLRSRCCASTISR